MFSQEQKQSNIQSINFGIPAVFKHFHTEAIIQHPFNNGLGSTYVALSDMGPSGALTTAGIPKWLQTGLGNPPWDNLATKQ